MPVLESQKIATKKYKRKNIKRIPLEMQWSDYEKMKEAAKKIDEPVNTYIKKAIAERMAKNT